MVGSAIWRKLEKKGFKNLIGRTSDELDLRDQQSVADFFHSEKPDYVILAAARVGGIKANNTYRGEFLYENLMIQNNVIHQSYVHAVNKLLFLGSSCIYPKHALQPLKEEFLLSGYLESTNEPYAIAKIAGIKMCESYRDQYGCNFISAMPTNLYGPNDNYHSENSHVLPALIRKFVEAVKTNQDKVEIWGTGTPKREFMHVDDLADASLYLMNHYDKSMFINVGVGEDLTVRELAELVAKITDFRGELIFDSSRPDGTMRKLLDISKMKNLGWKAKISLQEGIRMTVDAFKVSYFSKT